MTASERWPAGLVMAFLFVACTGANGKQGYPIALRMTPVAPSESCAAGGIVVESGLDDGDPSGIARNGTLEDGERDGDGVFVCHGVAGEVGPRGDSGATGSDGAQGPRGDKGDKGDRGDTGLQGEQGPPGERGAAGEQGPAGEQGVQGEPGDPGIQGDKGDPGAPGRDGHSIASTTETIPSGTTCAAGGTRIWLGVDDGAPGGVGDDGVLQDQERQSNIIVCNGASGSGGSSQGAAGLSMAFSTEAVNAGSGGCTTGGIRVYVGLDGNGDGTLQTGERKSNFVVCNGEKGAQGIQGIQGDTGASGVAGANCWSAIPGGTSVEDCVDYVEAQLTNQLGYYHVYPLNPSMTVWGPSAPTDVTDGQFDVVIEHDARALKVSWLERFLAYRGPPPAEGTCVFRVEVDGVGCRTHYLTVGQTDDDSNAGLPATSSQASDATEQNYVAYCVAPGSGSAKFSAGSQVHVVLQVGAGNASTECNIGPDGLLEVLEIPASRINL